jgi:hypothetical protein
MQALEPWETTEFKEAEIAYIVMSYGPITDTYIADVAAHDDRKEQTDGFTRLMYVDSIEPVRVAGQASYVIWFNIYLNGLKETVNPLFVSKVGYS